MNIDYYFSSYIFFSIYFHIFTACPYGFFGEECSEKCHPTCKNCNIFNGFCNFGCNPGWEGDFCHKGNNIVLIHALFFLH